MFHKILAAFDRSASGQCVFEEALALAKATGASLLLLHVLSHEEEDSPDMSPLFGSARWGPVISVEIVYLYQEQWRAFAREGLELLQSRAEAAIAAGVNAEYTQNIGSPARTICSVARRWDADLIVVGRRGRSSLGELVLGSVSNYVLHHASCSVLTVQGRVDSQESCEADRAERVKSVPAFP